MKYTIRQSKHFKNFIEIETQIENINQNQLVLHLSKWRPGRYEFSNYPKNIRNFKAFDENQNSIKFQKTERNKWQLETKNLTKLKVSFEYFAFELNAGASWSDENFLYVNPINCIPYLIERKDEASELTIEVPENYEIAIGLKALQKNTFLAKNFDELAEAPFIASPNLKHQQFKVKGLDFHIWIQGECQANWEKIIADCKAYSIVQIEMMGDFPVQDFHFLYILTPFRSYHGVEHTNSTVITLGPGYELMSSNIYTDFLGVSSHELFHVWNIKNIRPAAMLPYDYDQENYSKLGYVYEGFTTYYGDLFLARAKVFDINAYFNEINIYLKKHLYNYGRYNLSVAASSLDTWVDGYVSGIPNRKTSIYTEGAINALILDLKIRKASKNQNSLDDVLRSLYENFGKKNKGYSEKDLIEIVNELTKKDFSEHFEIFYNSPISLEKPLNEMLEYVGCRLIKYSANKFYEKVFGFRFNSKQQVYDIAPCSPAALSSLGLEDEIIAVNNIKADYSNLDQLIQHALSNSNEIELALFTAQKILKKIRLAKNDAHSFYDNYKISILSEIDNNQKENFKLWCGLELI